MVYKSWDFLDTKQRAAALKEIVAYFESERSEKMGTIAAGDLLDMLLQSAGGEVYNKALDDAREFLEKKFEDFAIDLDISLRK